MANDFYLSQTKIHKTVSRIGFEPKTKNYITGLLEQIMFQEFMLECIYTKEGDLEILETPEMKAEINGNKIHFEIKRVNNYMHMSDTLKMLFEGRQIDLYFYSEPYSLWVIDMTYEYNDIFLNALARILRCFN